MFRRLSQVALGVVLFSAAPLGVVLLSQRWADAWGTRAGGVLADWAAAVPRSPALVAEAPVPLLPLVPALESAASAVSAPRSRQAVRAPARRVESSARGVFVPARAVLALARAAVMPQAVPVPASGACPPGLRLASVGGLGIGMRDGDVLVRVAGTPVTSVATVAELVMRERARGARQISAEFWRDGAAWTLVVEQTYAPLG